MRPERVRSLERWCCEKAHSAVTLCASDSAIKRGSELFFAGCVPRLKDVFGLLGSREKILNNGGRKWQPNDGGNVVPADP